jgi:toxin ParE1/3/4
MPARKPRLIIAPRARRDLRSIRVYGLKQWGEAQADAYHAALTTGFERLQDHPQIGRVREDLGAGVRAWPVEHHVLYYRVMDDVIEVVRILHERADPARHLRP